MQILVEFNSIIHAVWFGEFDLEESLSVDSIMDVLENNYIYVGWCCFYLTLWVEF